MKKIILLLSVFFNILVAQNGLSVSVVEVDESKSDVYFANGINTKKIDAEKSIRKVKLEFKKYNLDAYKKVEKWNVSYNHTHGIGIDLYESMLQKMYEDDVGSSIAPFVWNFGEIFGFLDFSFKGLVKKIASKQPKEVVKKYAGTLAKKLAKKTFTVYNNRYKNKLSQEAIELMFTHVFDKLIDDAVGSYVDKTEKEIVDAERKDVEKQVNAYGQSIAEGHGVFVIAHSQGNLFTNRAYNEFAHSKNTIDYSWMQNYFSAIGLASPANNILGKTTPYITFDNDMIQLVQDSLPTNYVNPKRYFLENAIGEKFETNYSVEAHSFLNSYMKTTEVKDAILSAIKESIDKHAKKESQWEVDEEIGKDTKDYRISVKHKYQPNWIKLRHGLFPFNTDKKVYQVEGKYVKASCGGKHIKDTWEGKKDNEYWMIDNFEKEKIEGEEKLKKLTISPIVAKAQVNRYAYSSVNFINNYSKDITVNIAGTPFLPEKSSIQIASGDSVNLLFSAMCPSTQGIYQGKTKISIADTHIQYEVSNQLTCYLYGGGGRMDW